MTIGAGCDLIVTIFAPQPPHIWLRCCSTADPWHFCSWCGRHVIGCSAQVPARKCCLPCLTPRHSGHVGLADGVWHFGHAAVSNDRACAAMLKVGMATASCNGSPTSTGTGCCLSWSYIRSVEYLYAAPPRGLKLSAA